MSRITALMLALAAVVACQNKARQTGMRESAGGAVAPGAAPANPSTSNAPSSTAAGAARASSTATKNAADTMKNRTSNAANAVKNKTGAAMSNLGHKTRAVAESAGGAVSGAAAGAKAAAKGGQRFNLSKLSRDQVMQLQSALDSIGCNAGPKDGVAGAKTRQAVACGMQKNNIPSNNVDSLYRSLHLNFQR
jgi:peptidoglycan hydrolase-like protein with peptidoglycan-binding domain